MFISFQEDILIVFACRGQSAPLSPRGAPPLEAGPVVPADVQAKIVSQSKRMYVTMHAHYTFIHNATRTALHTYGPTCTHTYTRTHTHKQAH